MGRISCYDKLTFDAHQKSGKLCLVQFWSAWCGDCFNIKSLESFSSKNRDIPIFRLNVEDNEDIASMYHVKVVPSYYFFKDFVVVESLVGLQTELRLKEAFSKI